VATTPENRAEASISAEHLVRRFGKFTAVDDVSFRVEKGEIFGFLGPNGSGKTTVIKMLTGLLPLSSGSAHVEGLDVRADSEAVRERIGYMSQNYSLYQDLTVAENLQFYGRIYSLETGRLKRRIEEIVELNGLAPYMDRLSAQLSGGWKQRLALGCAMLHEPKLLFLDEPTAGIDPVARRLLWDLLFELSGHGITFFVTTHYMDEAERLCDRLAIVDHGQVIAEGTPADLIERLGGHHMVEFQVSGNSNGASGDVWRALPGVESVRQDNGFVCLNVHEPHLTIPALLVAVEKEGEHLLHLTTRQASLEDVFVRLTGRHLREE
jgi:ABC-type multidrug transport system ATPase subunit